MKKEEEYLAENYSTRVSLEKISGKLGRTIRSIQRKAQEMGISRPRKKFSVEKLRVRQRRAFVKYYKKHSKRVFENKKRSRIKKKMELMEVLGGRCCRCGYNRCFSALEFHHNVGDKDGDIAHIIKNRSRRKALKEIKKCILLCANCHREVHHKGL